MIEWICLLEILKHSAAKNLWFVFFMVLIIYAAALYRLTIPRAEEYVANQACMDKLDIRNLGCGVELIHAERGCS
jgi:uncharacterized protein involved in response to NO